MKNPIVASLIVVSVIVLLACAALQFLLGPASARTKESELNKSLAAFTSSEGAIASTASTDEAISAVFAGRPSSNVTIPKDYSGRGLMLSPAYEATYDPSTNSFKVSFSLIRFVTHKPHVTTTVADNS
jgi:hypothetical protein